MRKFNCANSSDIRLAARIAFEGIAQLSLWGFNVLLNFGTVTLGAEEFSSLSRNSYQPE